MEINVTIKIIYNGYMIIVMNVHDNLSIMINIQFMFVMFLKRKNINVMSVNKISEINRIIFLIINAKNLKNHALFVN